MIIIIMIMSMIMIMIMINQHLCCRVPLRKEFQNEMEMKNTARKDLFMRTAKKSQTEAGSVRKREEI